jgi:16S rRNA C1402 (ribose-2'-O) methylase RsmI
MSPGLYVVATPIGHLSDLSPRAAQTLCGVDVVAAEDTRVTRVLLRHAGSSARLISARAHNEQAAAQQIVGLLELKASRWRWSPMPARPPSATPAPRWSRPCGRPAFR